MISFFRLPKLCFIFTLIFCSGYVGATGIRPDTTLHWGFQLGYGYPFYYVNSYSPSNDNLNAAPIFFNLETDITQWLAVGLCGGYSQRSTSSSLLYDAPGSIYSKTESEENANALFGGLRLNLHYKYRKFEYYAGITGGSKYIRKEYLSRNYDPAGKLVLEVNNERVVGNPYYFAFTLGIRYFPIKNVGLFIETGRDFSAIAKGGLCFRFEK